MSDIPTISLAPTKILTGIVNVLELNPRTADPYGMSRKGQPVVEAMRSCDITELVSRTHDTDAHFVAYSLRDERGDEMEWCPRINKVALPHVRAVGGRVMMSAIVLDWDIKDFLQRPKEECAWGVLSHEDKEKVFDILVSSTERVESQGFPFNLFYTTPHGARLVHTFPEPVPAGRQFEALGGALRLLYLKAGLECDENCRDWTRMFRAPKVTLQDEDETRTWEQPWFQVSEQWDTLMAQPEIREEVDAPIEVSILTGDQPSETDARAQVEFLSDKGKWRKTDGYRKAKRLLGRTDFSYMDALFGDKPLASPGHRHGAIASMVGALLSRLHGCAYVTPEFLYGLAFPAIAPMGDNALAQLWENLQSFWAQEDGKAVAAKEVVQEAEEVLVQRQLSERELLLRGVRLWLPDIEGMPDGEAVAYLKKERFGIVRSQRKQLFYPMRPDGFYETGWTSMDCLRTRIRELGVDWLVPIEWAVTDDQNREILKPIPPIRIADDHARTFTRAVVDVNQPGCYLSIDPNTREGTLHAVPFALRADILAEFNEQVAEWLSYLVDEAEQEHFLRALACSLAIYDGPTAALSIQGVKSTGKTLLAMGLAECFTGLTPAPGEALVEKFNSSLLQSPIIWADEGVPPGLYDFGDQFRKVVAGGNLTVEPKGGERFDVRNVHRIVMTANNKNLLIKAVGTVARTEDDMNAIAERLTHFVVRRRAATYLESLGGRIGTAGWIEGDVPSRWVVARHFLWLYEQLPRDGRGRIKRPRGQRLLCQGSSDARIVHDAEANAGHTPQVLLFINRHLQSEKVDLVCAGAGRVHIRKMAVVAKMVEERHPTHQVIAAIDAHFTSAPNNKDYRPVHGAMSRKWKSMDEERFLRMVSEHL